MFVGDICRDSGIILVHPRKKESPNLATVWGLALLVTGEGNPSKDVLKDCPRATLLRNKEASLATMLTLRRERFSTLLGLVAFNRSCFWLSRPRFELCTPVK